MARVQFGGGITSMSGSIAGTTFQRNRSGNIARARIAPAQPLSILKNQTQGATTSLLSLFRNLNSLQQPAWQAFAHAHPRVNKYGQTKILSSWNYFQSINFNRSLVLFPPIMDPPEWILPPPINSLLVIGDVGAVELCFDPAEVPINTGYIIYTSPPLISNLTSFKSRLRFTLMIEDGTTSPIDIRPAWCAAHGLTYPCELDNGFYMGVQIYPIYYDSGLVAPAITQSFYIDD